MKTAHRFLLICLLAGCPNLAGAGEEVRLKFKSSQYPMRFRITPSHTPGTELYETPYSEIPAADYDTVLIEGVQPDPAVTLKIKIRSGRTFKTYAPAAGRRFPNGRFWTKYSLSAPVRQPLKITIVDAGAASPHVITIYGIEVLREADTKEAGGEKNFSIERSTEPDAGGGLPLVKRLDWKAALPKKSYTEQAPKMLTLHHTGANYPATREAALEEMLFIQDYHQNARGWIDIGYHFIISPQGEIFEGRPAAALGAHVKGKNVDNIGVSLMGNHHPPENQKPSQETLKALDMLGKHLAETYKIPAAMFYAHRDLAASDCPGDVLYAMMPEIRAMVFGQGSPPPQAPDPAAVVGAPPAAPDGSALRQLLGFSSGI